MTKEKIQIEPWDVPIFTVNYDSILTVVSSVPAPSIAACAFQFVRVPWARTPVIFKPCFIVSVFYFL